MTLTAALAWPKTMTRALFPDIDQRGWKIVLAIALFAVLGLKEAPVPLPLVIAAAAGGMLLLVVRSRMQPIVPLYLLVAYLPFSRILTPADGLGIPALSLINVLGAFVLATWARTRLAEPGPRDLWPAQSWPIAAYIGLSLLALAAAGMRYGPWYVGENAGALLRTLKPCAYFWLAYWVVRDAREIKTVQALITVSVTVIALMACYEYLDRAGSSFDRSRVQGIAGHPNTMGAFFVSYVFLLLGRFLMQPGARHTWPWLAGFLVGLRGIMVTFSRGAYAGFAVGLLTVCWYRSKLLLLMVLAAGGLLAAFPQLLPPGVRYRLEMTVEHTPAVPAHVPGETGEAPEEALVLEPSAASRLSIWGGALRAIRERPLWGLGPGLMDDFMPHYTQGAVDHLNAHNVFLNTAAEAGIAAAAALAAALLFGAWTARGVYLRARGVDPDTAALALGLLAGLAALIVVNCTSTTLESEEATGYLWILLGLVARAAALQRRATAHVRG